MLNNSLVNRRHAPALKYLKDVMTGFAASPVPPGRRSDHQFKSLYGSLFINIGIARPADTSEGKFEASAWRILNPFLGLPSFAIWQLLQASVENARERLFQAQFAPGIAAKWCNKLRLTVGGGISLIADFTLASSYRFNSSVRVDFQVDVQNIYLTREHLRTIEVRASNGLPPGSVANLRSINFTYQTDNDTRSVTVNQGVNDLVDAETGAVDIGGGCINCHCEQLRAAKLTWRAHLVCPRSAPTPQRASRILPQNRLVEHGQRPAIHDARWLLLAWD